MSAGTLKLTNNSTAVVGTSTLFTTDLKPGDFIVTTIGGVLYTLPVDTVTSNTAATLVSAFTGPTTTGAAWAAVPRKTMNQVTAELVAQSTEALRGLLTEKGVWTNFYTAPGDITVQLTPGMPAVTGPGWQKMASLVGSSQQWRGNLPAAANLNTYGPTADFTGTWNRSSNTNTTTAYGFPEDNGQGILEVYAGGRYGGMQRYTVSSNGNVYTRSLTAAWNGTGGPWGAWAPAGSKQLNDLGLGTVLPGNSTPFDWQQADFVTGQVIVASAINWVNYPPELSDVVADNVGNYLNVLAVSGTTVILEIQSSTAVAAKQKNYWVRLTGQKGSRTFSVRRFYTDVEMGVLGIGLSNMSAAGAFDWQQADLLTDAIYAVSPGSWLNAPSGVSYDTGTPAVYVAVDGIINSTTIDLTLTPSTPTATNYKIFKVRITGAKGSRTFSVRQVFTNTDIVPVANGGTGATTAAAARTALGVAYGTTAGTVAQGNDSRLGTIDGKSGGTINGNALIIGYTKISRTAPQAPTEGGNYQGWNTVNGQSEFVNHRAAGQGGHRFTIVNPDYTLQAAFSLSADGNGYAGNGQWVSATSGRATKTDIKEIDNPRDKMRLIKAATWVYKSKAMSGKFGIGVIADELYEAFPEARITVGDVELDDGSIVEDALSVQAGDSGVTAALHHATILSLMDENESQQVEIEALKSNLEELKKIVEGLIA